MKTIIWILLTGFLSFSGCSGSNDGTSATVGEATPVAPWAITETPTPTYKWTPVVGATKYRLVVQEKNQRSTIQDTNETAIIDEWYTAEEAGCASEDGLCKATPDVEVIGENEWNVQACANEVCSARSVLMYFESTENDQLRFTDNGDGTVTDGNTKLMWIKDANQCPLGHASSPVASHFCEGMNFAGFHDWRLPTLAELGSLMDDTQSYPALPIACPMVGLVNNDNSGQKHRQFWTVTMYSRHKIPDWFHWLVFFYGEGGERPGDDVLTDEGFEYYGLCARSPSGS